MGACVADQNSSQTDLFLLGAFVECYYLVGKPWNVDSCVALAGYEEIAAFVLRVVVEEHLEGFQVVFGY